MKSRTVLIEVDVMISPAILKGRLRMHSVSQDLKPCANDIEKSTELDIASRYDLAAHLAIPSYILFTLL